MQDDVDAAWVALRRCLETRSLELLDEVRTYPTPIARCDEQLTRVIEERDAAFRCLRLAAELESQRASLADAQWVRLLHRFAIDLDADDVGVRTARARLVAAIAP
jgi:hypothetical protein